MMTTSSPSPAPASAAAGPAPALLIRGMTKRFGDTVAVQDADLRVERGAFLGLVGPNGAGKTTLLSMATGPRRCSVCSPRAWPCRPG